MTSGDILSAQVDYYRARAAEYDQYYDRTGPFDLGPEGNAAWRAELEQVVRWVRSEVTGGVVLDLAAGTGWWTRLLASSAARLIAVDAAPEMLAVNRARNADASVELVESDVFAYRPQVSFDVVFFGFWLSHVPADLFDRHWKLLRSWLAPDGRVLLVDNTTSSAPWIQERPDGEPGSELMTRRLNDGRTFTIVKTHWTRGALAERLARTGWAPELLATPTYFVYGSARPAGAA